MLDRGAGEGAFRINRDLIEEVIRMRDQLDGLVDPAPPRLEALLSVRGAVEIVDEDPR